MTSSLSRTLTQDSYRWDRVLVHLEEDQKRSGSDWNCGTVSDGNGVRGGADGKWTGFVEGSDYGAYGRVLRFERGRHPSDGVKGKQDTPAGRI